MSGKRPLFRSPKFAEGMTSEAIEESGVKVCISAMGRGSGVKRRFESIDVNEPSDISILKPGGSTAKTDGNNFFSTNTSSLLSAGAPERNRLWVRRRAFWPSVCRTHHLRAPVRRI